MADVKTILSAIGTTNGKVDALPVKDGQLIFIRDAHSIALDFKGKRTYYNQIVSLQTEQERQSILAPVNGLYYFVIQTAVLWTYNNGWIQVTTPPSEIVSIGNTLPVQGSEQTLYVNKDEQAMYIWDDESSQYIPVSQTYSFITEKEILDLFTVAQ